ncbi:hypothetical protein HHK36_013251 [Tetracentron sinense]|uniref:FAR1 domain-containing protein n=1 Tax=Tetracentron sinense TaxID=13715 RepID=A0A834Z7E0_TETSI|nr:hypothetical protein HHK36_013251 [Tetracentron sinense]
MERAFDQGLDLDESDKSLQAETHDEQDTTQDELSKNLDICMGEDENIVEQSVGNSPKNVEALEPYVGMEFKSRDDAREFYIAYGRRTGFSVRINHNRHSRGATKAIIGQDFVCSKEGFRSKKYLNRKDRVHAPPPITREGCHAMLRIALKNGEKWVVTRFLRDHNHELMCPGEVPWRGSAKKLATEDDKDKRIRELSLELFKEKRRYERRCAAYEEHIHTIFKHIEEHTGHLSKKVQDVVHRIKKFEDDQPGGSGGR